MVTLGYYTLKGQVRVFAEVTMDHFPGFSDWERECLMSFETEVDIEPRGKRWVAVMTAKHSDLMEDADLWAIWSKLAVIKAEESMRADIRGARQW